MIKLGSFTLFISWKCNFACAHCGFLCSPERKEKMSLADAVNYIDQVSVNPDLEMIAFSGGEPFLYLAEIKELMAYSYQKGLAGGIVTNCYWAVDYPKTHKLLAELKALGLREIITSFDDYHLKYVPAQNIVHVLKAATRLGIYTGINILATKKSRIRKANVSNFLGIDLDAPAFLQAHNLWIKESSPLLVGRARKSFTAEELINYEEKNLLNNPCPYIIRNSIVTPEGNLYACCGFGDASERGPASLAYAGNLKSHGFKELFSKLSANLMFNIIYLYGPYFLIKLAQKSNPALRIKGKYVSNCEVCAEITRNPELRMAVSNLLKQLSRQAIAQKPDNPEVSEHDIK